MQAPTVVRFETNARGPRGAVFTVSTVRKLPKKRKKSGSAGRIRTYDQPVNSRLLYH
jgi:hypothetical protein